MDTSGKEKYRSTKINTEKNNREDADKKKTYMGNSKTKGKGPTKCGDCLIQAAPCVLGTDGHTRTQR
jgi:hypothetical protein